MAASKRKPTSKRSGKDGAVEKLAGYLRARAPAEDLEEYDASVIAHSAAIAYGALKKHRRGDSVISIENEPEMVRHGRPLTVITVVNDNMPFLFDSILGEITESAGEPTLVLHPVILARHDRAGVAELVGDATAGKRRG